MRAAPTSLRVTIDLWSEVQRLVDALPLPPPHAAAKQTSSASAVAKRRTGSAYASVRLREEVLQHAAGPPRPAEAPALVGHEHPPIGAVAAHDLAAQVLGAPLDPVGRLPRLDRGRERVRRLEAAGAAAAERQTGTRQGGHCRIRRQIQAVADGDDRVVVELDPRQRRLAERTPVRAVGPLRLPPAPLPLRAVT